MINADLENKQFGRLTVLEYKGIINKNKKKYWLCKCSCGNVKIINGFNLIYRTTQSCGCIKKDKFHNMKDTRMWNIWNKMRQRCNNANVDSFRYYGGRGIKVCQRWSKFENFYIDMKDTYNDNLSIDRINVNGNYCKRNCKWSTNKEQANNKRNSKKIK